MEDRGGISGCCCARHHSACKGKRRQDSQGSRRSLEGLRSLALRFQHTLDSPLAACALFEDSQFKHQPTQALESKAGFRAVGFHVLTVFGFRASGFSVSQLETNPAVTGRCMRVLQARARIRGPTARIQSVFPVRDSASDPLACSAIRAQPLIRAYRNLAVLQKIDNCAGKVGPRLGFSKSSQKDARPRNATTPCRGPGATIGLAHVLSLSCLSLLSVGLGGPWRRRGLRLPEVPRSGQVRGHVEH